MEAVTAVDPIAKVSEIAIVNFWFTIFFRLSIDPPENKSVMLVIGMVEIKICIGLLARAD